MAIVIDAGQREAAFKAAGSDLLFLLDRKQVDSEFQAKLFHIGVTSVELLSVFAKNQDDLEELLKKHFGLDPENIMHRVSVGRIVVAWMAAKTRSTKQAELDGECEARKVPKDIGMSDVASMRTSFEKIWWELEDRPAKSYLEKKLDEVEKEDLRAELLSEVVSVPEDDPDSLKTVWTSSNELRAVKVASKVSLPRDPEEFRRRITLLGTAWLFISYQQTHKAYLKGLSPQIFTEYLSYLLGEFVFGLCARDSGGSVVSSPAWALIVSYEHAIRCKALTLVKKGATLKDALRTAWEDPITKERYFTTPLCLDANRKRPADFNSQPPFQKFQQKGQGSIGHKGGSKGSGKSQKKGKKGGPRCAAETPDGQKICYSFNTEKNGCKRTGCSFLHACGICFAKGSSMRTCTHTGAGAGK